MTEYKVQNWLDDAQLKTIGFSDYWNNEEHEKIKEWYVLDGDFSKMEGYLLKTGLPLDYEECLKILKEEFNYELKGVGIDLASGNLWSAKSILKSGLVDTLYCLEFSKHRLLKLGPKVLEHYDIPKDKAVLVWGSFYDLKVGNDFFDFVYLSAAFHHADRPQELLKEIKRVLKPGGVVIIIGEFKINWANGYIKNFLKAIISRTLPAHVQQRLFGKSYHGIKFFPKAIELFPPDPVLGDHYYTDRQYQSMFTQQGFKVRGFKRKGSETQSFILFK